MTILHSDDWYHISGAADDVLSYIYSLGQIVHKTCPKVPVLPQKIDLKDENTFLKVGTIINFLPYF